MTPEAVDQRTTFVWETVMLGVCNSETLEQLARVDASAARTQHVSSLRILTKVAIWSPEYARGAVADIDVPRNLSV